MYQDAQRQLSAVKTLSIKALFSQKTGVKKIQVLVDWKDSQINLMAKQYSMTMLDGIKYIKSFGTYIFDLPYDTFLATVALV